MKLVDEDEDNSQAFAQRRACRLCEEKFSLGEMLPGQTWLSPMRCPYCKSDETAREGDFH
jgi:transcriptional regulator NrdR family protein